MARKWLDGVVGLGVRTKLENIVNEIEELGLPPVPVKSNFRSALIHLGNELVKNELVKLAKKAGLTKVDVETL